MDILRNGDRRSHPMTDTPPPQPAAPDHAALREAALRHLARYAATRARLLAVLTRRIERWAAAASAAGAADIAGARAAACAEAARVVDRLAEAGALDDAAFAAQRARRLARAGRSRRAVAAHLAGRGVAGDVLRAALPEDAEAELAAALATARRRRIGPFRAGDAADGAALLRERGMLARAGFVEAVARRALAMPREEAEARLAALRRD
jgi:regulatory protein